MTETKQNTVTQPSNWFRKIVTGGSPMKIIPLWLMLGAALSLARATGATNEL